LSNDFRLGSFVLGVDPGKDGGVAALLLAGEPMMTVTAMPTLGKSAGAEMDIRELKHWLDSLVLTGFLQLSLVCIEKQSSRPQQSSTAMGTFLRGYGELLGAFKWAGAPLVLATPQDWKDDVLRGTKKEKDDAVAYVKRRWPALSLLATEKSRSPHDGMAEAVCIAEHARTLLLGGGKSPRTNKKNKKDEGEGP